MPDQAEQTKQPEQAPAKQKRKKSLLLRFLLMLLLLAIAVPLALEVFYFLTRVTPAAVIPDGFFVYAHTNDTRRLASKILEHESLPELLSNPALASLTPLVSGIRSSGLLEKSYTGLALRGSVSAALVADPARTPDAPAGGAGELDDGSSGGHSFIAAWDSAFLAPALRFLPLVFRLYQKQPDKNPNLHYVEGEVPHFEYRSETSTVYIGTRRNLVIAANNEALFFVALSPEGASHASQKGMDITRRNQAARRGANSDPDMSLILASRTVTAMLGEGNPLLAHVFADVSLPDHVELGITFEPKQLNISMAAPVTTANSAFAAILANNSVPPSLMNIVPDSAQYVTSLASLGLREVINAAAQLPETGLADTLATADKTARTLFGLSVDDLLYSWSGDECAVFGLEDRPAPVFAVKIADEAKRKAIFDKVFHSIFVKEDSTLVLDGNRIPRMELPAFVDAILRIIKVTLPRPYYMIHENWLLVSESPENLLASVEAVRQGRLLAKTETWQKLSGAAVSDPAAASGTASAASSLSLFYSLNRSLPFFLNGQSAAASVLRMYRQGLMNVSVEDGVLTITLAAEPGAGKGLESMQGYPISIGDDTGNAVYAIRNGSGSESRLLLSRGTSALAVNPADHKIYELQGEDPVWVIPAEGITPRTMRDSAAWVVSSRGLVTLVNGNMEAGAGFPVMTGLRLSSAPAAHNGRLYLFAEEAGGKGTIYTADSAGLVSKLQAEFDSPVLSPPAFLDDTMALYPKSFTGEIFLCDADGNPKPSWPVTIPGIAYGSPLPFQRTAAEILPKTFVAFITAAGELFVLDEQGLLLPMFPLELPGVFYVQPVWDGTYLWAVSEEGVLYRVSPESSLPSRITQQKLPDLTVGENGCLITADVDGDGISEIFVTGEGNALYGYTRNMISIDGFPLSAWGRPAFSDLDGDGVMDCAAAGMDNRLYRWRFRSGQ